MADWGQIQYARSGDSSIAFRIGGAGPIDLLFITGFISHLEIFFELPAARHFFDRLASFARVIVFDKRGMGLSDRHGAYTIENVAADAVAVLDAAGSERAALFGVSEGGPASAMLAASRPDRVSSMALYGTYARLTRTDDYPEGIPLEVLRENWSAFNAGWGSPASLGLFAPSMAGDPELREWWGRMMRSGASPGVIETLGEYMPDIEGAVEQVEVLAPPDIERRFGLLGGNIMQGEMTPDQSFFLRPILGYADYTTPIEGLFLCGSGAHPGGGVMGSAGRNAATALLAHQAGAGKGA